MFLGMECTSKDTEPVETVVPKIEENPIRVKRSTFIGRKHIIIKSIFYHKTEKTIGSFKMIIT